MSATLPPDFLRARGIAPNAPFIAAGETQASARELIGLYESDPIGYLANRMAEGTTITIDWRGDSTFYGYLLGGSRASPTPIESAQAACRAHYNNTAAVFVNNGVSGYGTSDVIATWGTLLGGTASDAVVIGYGANDAQGATSPAITADQYADNLRSMTRTARALGKIVIFETPVPFWDYGSIGTQTKAQRSIQFAETMRMVAREMVVPVIDTFAFFDRLIKTARSPFLTMDDGIHPTQAGYTARGYFQANAFYQGTEISQPGYTAQIAPSIRQYAGATNDIIAAAGSRMGAGRIANKISIPILITAGGLDIYLSTPRWVSGSDVVTLTINGAALSPTFSLYLAGTGSDFFVDAEHMVLRNATPGAYLIQIAGEGSEAVGLYYVRAAQTRAWNNLVGSSVGTGATIMRWQSLGDLVLSSSAGNTAQNHGITEISLSNLIAETAVEFEATLNGNEGVSIFGAPKANSAFPQGGYVMFLSNTTGYLTIATASAGGYTDLVAVGGIDLRGLSKTYRLVAKTDGTLEAFVDAVSVGTYTPATTVYRGGFVGVYSSGASKTVTLKNVRVY